MEKSLYQDVLVFKSTNHGNVLVLDGAIQVRSIYTLLACEILTDLSPLQCVERDEFS
jgi:spermidine synthase